MLDSSFERLIGEIEGPWADEGILIKNNCSFEQKEYAPA